MNFRIVVYNGDEDVRLDRFLKREIPNITQGIIEKSFRKGIIKVNGKVVKSGFRLKGQDEIRISERLYENFSPILYKVFSPQAISLANKILNEYLIFDHPEFIALNKPAKLASQGGSKISLSVDEALSYLNSLGNNYKLVHRIDKDTSGILLIARGSRSAAKITKAFQDNKIKKSYLAIVEGSLPQQNGEIKGLITKNNYILDSGSVVYKQGLGKFKDNIISPKFAITKYKLIKKLASKRSLVEFSPITGRMHQLRIHAKEMGCPIMGDKKYGVKNNISNNMMLHAAHIVLTEEIFGQKIKIEAELPLYFKKMLNKTGCNK